ncbi:hypothetical protein DVK85_00135 [Flavobacterium arcticum]|uniref:Tetratricopeptide repeat protein n=1 Tax=Flavobacterium arcticum TaxID=1784713 RepID=A0A345H813_9FLAO|nr:DUF6584 family protein [Flavobacterium arcticum]AXG72723.1 hypothetical protein DVK85_00135 [Flavobacterium arcticum]KAF2511006.1 hypothetical protein E0W72_06330 [Flavobacterium arcticum]
MYLNVQLEKAQTEINKGLKQRAINRLKNVLNTYPDATEAREVLALLYYESGFLDMAGLYWVLTEPTHDYIRKSVKVYQESVNNSPIQILNDLKYRGDKSGLPEYARKRLLSIENEVKSMGHSVRYKPKKYKELDNINYKETFKEKLITKLLIGIFFLCILFFITGIVTAISWIISLF